MKKHYLIWVFIFLSSYTLFGQLLKYPSSYKCEKFFQSIKHYDILSEKMTQRLDTVSFHDANTFYKIDVYTEDSISLIGLYNGNEYVFPCKYSIDSTENKLFMIDLLANDSGLTDIKCMGDSISLSYCNFQLHGNNTQVTGYRIANGVNIDSLIDTLVSKYPGADSITIIQGHGIFKNQPVSIKNINRNSQNNNLQNKFVKMIAINDSKYLPSIDLLGRNIFNVKNGCTRSSLMYICKTGNLRR